MINIFVACIATLIVSVVAIPLFTLLYMFTIGFLTSLTENKKIKDYIIALMQFLGYFSADFCGLTAGIFILKSRDNTNFYPLLVIIIFFTSISYFLKRFAFQTREAEVSNIRQKILNIGGAIFATIAAWKLLI